jgi:hypothetical protein
MAAKGLPSALIAAIVLTGCTAPDKLYRDADRATYDVIAPEYLGYVKRDKALDAEAVNVREATIRTWRERIEAYESEATAKK